jgi:hypothetical protein
LRLRADLQLVLLWIMVPPGLDGFFRETCSRSGEPRKQFDAGAVQRDRSQTWGRIQVGRLKHLQELRRGVRNCPWMLETQKIETRRE